MAITFAGVTLCDPAAEPLPGFESALEWVEDNISLKRLWQLYPEDFWPSHWLYATALPASIEHSNLPLRLNSLNWPQGAMRWASFHTIVFQRELDQIRTAIGTSNTAKALNLSWYDPQSGADDKLQASIETNMYMLPARPLDQLALGVGNVVDGWMSEGIYLLSLVDERWWWWFKDTGNISITEGTTTWANLYTSLGTALGITITADAIDADYLKPSKVLQLKYAEHAPVMLDCVAANVGQRIVRKLDGSVLATLSTSATTTVTSNLALSSAIFRRAGGRFAYGTGTGNDRAKRLPATVRVVFPVVSSNVLQESPYTKDVSLSTGTAAMVKTVQESANADGNPPSNQTEIDTLASQIATDYEAWAAHAQRLDLKYDGIVPWVAEGLHIIDWTHREDEVTTRIQLCSPPDFFGYHSATTYLSTDFKWSFWGTIYTSSLYVNGSQIGRDIGCRAKNSGSQTFTASAAAAAVTFDQEDYDTDTMHSTSSNTSRITFTTAGKYYVWFNGLLSLGASTPSAGSYWTAQFYVNGSAVKGQVRGDFASMDPPGTGSATYESVGGPMVIIEDTYAATDYIEIKIANNDAAADATLTSHVFGARKVDRGG